MEPDHVEHRDPHLKFKLSEDAQQELDDFVHDLYLNATDVPQPWPCSYAEVWEAVMDYAASEMGREALRASNLMIDLNDLQIQRCILCSAILTVEELSRDKATMCNDCIDAQ